MTKATAIWLIENTRLNFTQIAEFCGLHPLEVQAIADGEASIGMVGLDPITSGQLTHAEIERCEADTSTRLVLTTPIDAASFGTKKKGKYTPVARRHERPDAIAWILKHHPEIPDSKIVRLLGTTKPMIQSVRSKTHWNSTNIKAQNPIQLGFCTQVELDQVIAVSLKESQKTA